MLRRAFYCFSHLAHELACKLTHDFPIHFQQDSIPATNQALALPHAFLYTSSITGGIHKKINRLSNRETTGQDRMILEVFISNAHQDQAFRRELDTHLNNLKRQGILSSWSDGDIVPGTEWRPQIMTHLNTAQIILLLISADFMASEFCFSIEMTRAIERHKANEARVLPIILRPCDWKGAPFAELEVLPTKGKPVMRWPSHDDAFADVVQGIRRAIDDLARHRIIAHP